MTVIPPSIQTSTHSTAHFLAGCRDKRQLQPVKWPRGRKYPSAVNWRQLSPLCRVPHTRPSTAALRQILSVAFPRKTALAFHYCSRVKLGRELLVCRPVNYLGRRAAGRSVYSLLTSAPAQLRPPREPYMSLYMKTDILPGHSPRTFPPPTLDTANIFPLRLWRN